MSQNPVGQFYQTQQKHFLKKSRNCSFEDDISNIFNKKFQFRPSFNWTLPEPTTLFTSAPWNVKQLQVLKSCLNFHKSQLNDFNIEEWSAHTRRRNPAGDVSWKLKCSVNPEFLTQAWTKFYECAYTYDVVPQDARRERKMVSLHLCEAPGAFITSLNHYLKCHHTDIDWKWLASTLNPYYEGNSPSNMISDDRFMFHTLSNWDFGADNTGNLMNWDNAQSIINRAKGMGKVMLVTGDGSIDCLERPDAQEEVTSALHFCEIITALQALSKGGTLIYKLFTMFEHSTINLLYLVNILFREVNIYKPVTSRGGNSEVYAVCLGFKGLTEIDSYMYVIKAAFGTELYGNSSLFSLSAIPEDFLKQVEECSYYFCTLQCQVINDNLQGYPYHNNIGLYNDVKRLRVIVAAEFMMQYDLRPIIFDNEILKGALHEDNKINTNPRYHRGSYTERQHYETMSLKEKLIFLNTDLQANLLTDLTIFISEQVRWIQLYDEKLHLELSFGYGKTLDRICSSKFIFTPVLRLFLNIVSDKELCEMVSADSSDLSSDELSKKINVDSDELKILVLAEYDYLESYDLYEKRMLKELCTALRCLPIGGSLFLKNFNLLTHFNVGVFFILCKMCFKITGFTDGKGVLLKNYVRRMELLDLINNECAAVKVECHSVLRVLPVQVTNEGEFCNSVIFYNNTFYRNKIMGCLNAIQQKL